jgi:hypothetical protein
MLAPMPKPVCHVLIFVERFSSLCYFGQILCWQTVKCIHLSHWKHLVRLNDEFLAIFITCSNIFLCAVFVLFFDAIGFQNGDMDYHICLGRPALVGGKETPNGNENVFGQALEKDPVRRLKLVLILAIAALATYIWIRGKMASFRQDDVPLEIRIARLFLV